MVVVTFFVACFIASACGGSSPLLLYRHCVGGHNYWSCPELRNLHGPPLPSFSRRRLFQSADESKSDPASSLFDCVCHVQVLDPRNAVKDTVKMGSDKIKSDISTLMKYRTDLKEIASTLVSRRERVPLCTGE